MPKPHRPAKLTPDQIPLWAANYIQDFNAARVAREFGYAEGSARRRAAEIMEDPLVQAAISEAVKAATKRAEWDADAVLKRIRKQYRCADNEKDRSNALKALDMYGRHLGIFKALEVELGKQTLEALVAGSYGDRDTERDV